MSKPKQDPQDKQARRETEARLSTMATELLPKWRQYFGSARWAALLKQITARGMTQDTLARHISTLRSAHPCSDAAWPVQAAHLALCLCGSVPTPEDHERLMAASGGLPIVSESPVSESPVSPPAPTATPAP